MIHEMNNPMVSGTTTQPIISTHSVNRTEPKRELFVILWCPWKVEDEDDRVRIWGIFTDESESKRELDKVRKAETPLNKRGGFSWIRYVGDMNCGPEPLERTCEFGIGD